MIAGKDYRIMRRAAFGEGDKQHIVFGRSKDKDKKTGCVIAHSDYTVTVAVYDEEQNQRDGALSVQVQQLMMRTNPVASRYFTTAVESHHHADGFSIVPSRTDDHGRRPLGRMAIRYSGHIGPSVVHQSLLPN